MKMRRKKREEEIRIAVQWREEKQARIPKVTKIQTMKKVYCGKGKENKSNDSTVKEKKSKKN